ncbi:MAG: protein-glutamate O-methyltransferase CheR [Nitrospirae bacterium]|nr:protein-glutamate O-methyltransferase CheR [Nitrospirota bacterium]
MSDDTFRLIRDFIRNYCGVYFDDGSKFLLEKRLSRRVENYLLNNFEDYYHFLMYDKRRDEELASVIDVLTVNETYFFREFSQLKALSDEIIPEIGERRKDKKRLRIWSAGCSTGEEPYTIAILILEKNLMPEWEIEILGSDINQRVIHAARRGIYRKNAFRSIDDYYIRKYFTDEGEGNYRIVDPVRSLVNFSLLNLVDPFKVRFVGKMDVIFCRNVIIYFDRDAKKKVINNFYDRLTEEGYLLLGHSESLMNISTDFMLKHLKNDLVYQKPTRSALTGEMVWKR